MFRSVDSDADTDEALLGGVVGGVVGVVVILSLTFVVIMIAVAVLRRSRRGHNSTGILRKSVLLGSS